MVIAMTNRARELLELAYQYIPLSSTTSQEIRAYLAEPEVKREALSEDEIDSLFTCDETSPEYEHGFRDGIWFAEKHHGIGGEDENTNT